MIWLMKNDVPTAYKLFHNYCNVRLHRLIAVLWNSIFTVAMALIDKNNARNPRSSNWIIKLKYITFNYQWNNYALLKIYTRQRLLLSICAHIFVYVYWRVNSYLQPINSVKHTGVVMKYSDVDRRLYLSNINLETRLHFICTFSFHTYNCSFLNNKNLISDRIYSARTYTFIKRILGRTLKGLQLNSLLEPLKVLRRTL